MKMTIELEFLDTGKVGIHEQPIIYDNFSAPVPHVGDTIYLEGNFYKVVKRDFIYLFGEIDLKISFWCEELSK